MDALVRLLVVGLCTLALAGCGTRDDAVVDGDGVDGGSQSGGGGSGGTPDSAAGKGLLGVRVLSDVNRVETGGAGMANISALVTNEDNNAVADQPVSFRASGGILQDVSATTDENGVARATLRLLRDFRIQDITITVTAGDATGEALVSADGSELEVGGPSNLIEGASAELVAVLSAGDGEPIVNEPIVFESVAGNAITPREALTDIDGRVTVSVDSFNGDDTIRLSALAGTVVADHVFTVSTDTLSFVGIDVDTEFEVGADHAVTVVWTSGDAPVGRRALRFSTTAGNIVGERTIETDGNGRATVMLRSDSAGTARLSVESAGDGGPSSHTDVEFVASAPAAVSIGASSTRVAVRGTSTVTARVTDANGNPVRGTEVVFRSDDLKGGQLNPAVATTGGDGVASVVFTAGAGATALDEIALVAEVEGVDPSDDARTTLSVVERALNVTLGSANKVTFDGEGPVQYWLNFVVQVADGSGAPLEGADVSLSIQPLWYRKGLLSMVDEDGRTAAEGDEDWEHAGYSMRDGYPEFGARAILCEAEDSDVDVDGNPANNGNGNRILDVGSGEDRNGNGVLDPQDPASLVASTDGRATLSGASLVTDVNGSGYFRMIYPVSNAQWAGVRITARARDLGAEASDSFDTDIPMLADELNQNDYTPANYASPYGTELDCGNDR